MNVVSSIGSPAKESSPLQVTVPETPLESTSMSKFPSNGASLSACSPVMFQAVSPNQVILDTCPSNAVIRLTSLSVFVSTVKSFSPLVYSPERKTSFAAISS
ncbi:MAG: Uncharacterised protein [Methanobacteriota archaeon]|nr:MAG: Uncharacterised protein [Euryarchaeota archaeon]